MREKHRKSKLRGGWKDVPTSVHKPGGGIDSVDFQILSTLQGNAKISNAEIARQVGMVPSGIFERIRRLERRKLILGYQAHLNPQLLGLGLVAFVFVRADERVGSLNTAALLARIPEVQEVHHISGEDCYLVKMRTSDPKELGRILRERVGTIKSVRSTKTTIVLETVKETSAVPLSAPITK